MNRRHRSTSSAAPAATRRHWALRLGGLAVLLAVIAAVAPTIDVPSLGGLRQAFAGRGRWTGVVFAAIYAAATLSPLPKSVFTLAAGALRGRDFLLGTVIGILPATTASVAV